MSTIKAPTDAQVETIVRLQLGLARVRPGDHLTETLGAASVDIVNIVATMEESFGIEIDEMDLADLASVADLCRIARNRWSPPG